MPELKLSGTWLDTSLLTEISALPVMTVEGVVSDMKNTAFVNPLALLAVTVFAQVVPVNVALTGCPSDPEYLTAYEAEALPVK